MISTDKDLFLDNSAVLNRQVSLLEKYNNIYIIVFSNCTYSSKSSMGRIFIYPTRSISKFTYIFDALIKSFKLVRLEKIDIITCQDPFETGLVGLIISKIFKINLEVQVHTDFVNPYFYRLSFLNRLRYFIGCFILPKADKVRVVSSKIYTDIKSIVDESKIYIKPIWIDQAKILSTPVTVDLHKKYPQFKKIVLMVSRLEPEKNIALAIYSVAKIKNLDVGLVIVGSGTEKNNLIKLAKDLKVDVIFEGQVDSVVTYYKTADLFLHTSFYEGYGLVLKEAKMVGLPIISTNVGVAEEVGAEIVEFDSDQIAKKISYILK